MNRRRFLGVAGAAGLLGGCDFSFSDGIFNACHAVMPQHLRTHALVAAAWHGLDARDVWDVHCHVIGNGDSGRGDLDQSGDGAHLAAARNTCSACST